MEPDLVSLLREEETVIVATLNGDGSPHVAPVWFVTLDERVFFFQSGTSSAMFRNLSRNGQVALCFGERSTHMPTYIMTGTARVRDGELSREILHASCKKYDSALARTFWTDKRTIFEMIPDRKFGWSLLKDRHTAKQ